MFDCADVNMREYIEAVENLFHINKLFKDELIINDEQIDLSKITCPIVIIAGESDDITLPGMHLLERWRQI